MSCNDPTCPGHFSGLTETQHRLLRVQALLDAAEAELYRAQSSAYENAPDRERFIKACETLRDLIKRWATWCGQRGWPWGDGT
ncbi:MAG: hypothetical protein IT371_09945 [Deltaproteobacteria bacterium]|nr:hypothetical protein [Deltaproteobacteria bacterium]